MHRKRLFPALVLSAAFGLLPAAAVAADGDGMQSFAVQADAAQPATATRSRVTYADLGIGQGGGIFNPNTGRYAGGSLSVPQAPRSDNAFAGAADTAAPMTSSAPSIASGRSRTILNLDAGSLAVPMHREFGRIGTS